MDADAVFHFPYLRLGSQDEFKDYLRAGQTLLDRRYAYETERAKVVQPETLTRSLTAPILVSAGTCALCLRPTEFTTVVASGGVNWREQQICGCVHRLTCRFRALLHYIVTEIGPPPWTRLLLLGSASTIEPWLQKLAMEIAVRARGGRLLQPPQFEAQQYHLVVSCEHLGAEPELDGVLRALRAALLPGGQLVFTAPFDTTAATSRACQPEQPGVLGWDIMERLRDAGFFDPAALLFWSEEFGYLGAYNMIFTAIANE
jgi:hypothetical protein